MMIIKDNKGFMMAEVVVVSAAVLLTITTLYTGYGKILLKYKERFNYQDVTTLYRLDYYIDNLEDGAITSSESGSNYDIKKINDYNDKVSTMIKLDNDYKKLNNPELNDTVNEIKGKINKTFKDYLDYLTNSTDFSSTSIVYFLERCNKDNTNCKYAYLEEGADNA